MIAVQAPCLFFSKPCVRAYLRQQYKCARKLCSDTLSAPKAEILLLLLLLLFKSQNHASQTCVQYSYFCCQTIEGLKR